MALIKCPECNAEISDKAKICPKCGKDLKPTNSAKKCPECGIDLKEDDMVCTNCGFPIDKAKNDNHDSQKEENNTIIKVVDKKQEKKKSKIAIILVIAIACILLLVFLKMSQVTRYDFTGYDDKNSGMFISKEISKTFGNDFGETWIELDETNQKINVCLFGIESGMEPYFDSSNEVSDYVCGVYNFDIGYDEVRLHYDGYVYHFKKA